MFTHTDLGMCLISGSQEGRDLVTPGDYLVDTLHHCFTVVNSVGRNHREILLKCRFSFRSSKVGPGILFS